MIGVIYLISNIQRIRDKTPPYFYIGSKSKLAELEGYWSSSKYVLQDIKKYGLNSFIIQVLEEVPYSNINELLLVEALYHKRFNCKNHSWFYNRMNAAGPFHFSGGTHTKETLWINNGKTNKRVTSDKLLEMKELGFVEGRFNFSKNRGKIYINKGGKTKSIDSVDLTTYEKLGWTRGKPGNQKGKIWINKNGRNKLIDGKALNTFLCEGWNKGFTFVLR